MSKTYAGAALDAAGDERRAFMAYLAAIGRTVGHDATAEAARAACPSEYRAWRRAFRRAYGCYPA